MKKFIFILMLCFLLSAFNMAEAGQAGYYTNLIRNGKYHIVCSISTNYNRNGGENSESNQDIVLLEDKERGISYYSKYAHAGKYYILTELFEYNNQLYSRYNYSKKELDVDAEKQKPLHKIDKSHHTYWPYYATPRAWVISTVFSCLGEISEKNGILKNYKTEFRKTGNFEQDGILFNYDEYLITAPEKGNLQIQYQDGILISGIKLLNDKEVNHPLLFSNRMKEDRMEAVLFEKFDDDVDALVRNLIARSSK